jgi:hypothetical protein
MTTTNDHDTTTTNDPADHVALKGATSRSRPRTVGVRCGDGGRSRRGAIG